MQQLWLAKSLHSSDGRSPRRSKASQDGTRASFSPPDQQGDHLPAVSPGLSWPPAVDEPRLAISDCPSGRNSAGGRQAVTSGVRGGVWRGGSTGTDLADEG